MEAAVFVLMTWFAMGNEINKANENIKMLEGDIYDMSIFQQQQIDENIKQQEAINDLIISLEKLESKVEELEDEHDADFVNLAAKQASQYARHETLAEQYKNLLAQQKLDLELMKLRTDSVMEQMRIVREGIGSD